MRLSKLIRPGEYQTKFDPEKIDITHISHKLEDIRAGSLFICLKGQRFDSHSIAPALGSHGAAAVLAEEGALIGEIDIPFFTVPSTRKMLAVIWNRFVGEPTESMTFIGVTGTNGKTSTAYFLNEILMSAGYQTAMIGTLGLYIKGQRQFSTEPDFYTMTTPDPDVLYPFLVKAKDAGATHVVMEVSSHALAYDKVSPIRFKEAIFTNLSPEHLDFHKTMEEYGEAKKKLFTSAEHATIYTDDAFGAALAAIHANTTTCGILWPANTHASQIAKCEPDCFSYFYTHGQIRQLVKLSVGGRYQVINSQLALTSAISLGIPAGVATRAIAGVMYIPGRLQRISTRADDIEVYIDFAHTEAALCELLKGLRAIAPRSLTVVFGCGGERDALKRPLMGACAMKHADFSVITSDNSRGEDVGGIIKDILRGHTAPERRKVIIDRKRAIEYAISNAGKHDVIVLAGKGHEEYEIRKDGIHPFSESKIAREALEMRRAGHTISKEKKS